MSAWNPRVMAVAVVAAGVAVFTLTAQNPPAQPGGVAPGGGANGGQPVEPPIDFVDPPQRSPDSGGGIAAGGPTSIVVPGADGSDGPLNVTSANLVVDLSLATTGPLESTAPATPGRGVYDPEKWAVVFRYSSVNVAAGRTVTFLNHPSGAPVVWLVGGPNPEDGTATIAGTVALNGGQGHSYDAPANFFAVPGPGGFRGGIGTALQTLGSGGFGPGGASSGDGDQFSSGTGGSYGSQGAQGDWGGGAP